MKATEKQKQAMKKYAQKPEVKIRRKKYMQEYNNKYERINSERISKRKKVYYKRNKEIIDERNKGWMRNNKDVWNKYRIGYYNKNKKKIIAYGSEWERNMKKNDINFAIRKTLRSRLKQAFKNYSKFGKTNTSDEYGIDYNAIIEYLKPFPKNRHLYHIDHIIPCCSFDLTDIEQIRKCFAPENHQWLLIKDNLSKISSDKKQSLRLKNNHSPL